MIRNIIFDFGGVVLKHKAILVEDTISEIFSIPAGQALEVWKRWKTEFITGKISSEQFLTNLKNELNSDKPIHEILKEWKDIYVREAEVDLELLGLIGKLKRNYGVYLFTDTNDIHDEYNSTRGIYDRFTKVFKSNKEGLSKLNDDAFLNVLKKIGAKPEECIFIDDLPLDVTRANNLGIHGILYKNKEELKQELSRFGVMTTHFKGE